MAGTLLPISGMTDDAVVHHHTISKPHVVKATRLPPKSPKPPKPHLTLPNKPIDVNAYEYKKIDLREHRCLAVMIYGEARGESKLGQYAVAYTAINRASGQKNGTVCSIVLAPGQYTIFNDNPAMRTAALNLKISPTRFGLSDKDAWERSQRIAQDALKQEIPDPTKGATNYLAPTLMKVLGYQWPPWTKKFKMTVVIENHHFFKPPSPNPQSPVSF
jgi:spore germination cell wall hydrolase CwlJ-like protein